MKYLVLVLSLVSFGLYGQGIEPSSFQPTPYKDGVLVGKIQMIDDFTGDTVYMYQHVSRDSIAIPDSIYLTIDTIKLRDGDGNVVLPKWYIGETLPSSGSPYKYGDIFVENPYASCIYSYVIYKNVDTSWLPLFTIIGCDPPYIDPDADPTNELADFQSFFGDFWLGTPKKGDIKNNTTENRLKIWDGSSFVTMWQTDTTAISQIISDSLATIPRDSTGIVDDWGLIAVEMPNNIYNLMADSSQVFTQYDGTLKQDVLISGTNIKTVNSNSLLGSGNISVGTVTSITANAPLTGGIITSTGSIGADTTSTTGLSTQFDLTLKQDKLSGANKRIPYFTGTNTLSNSDNLVFDNATKYLGIGTASPDATIHMTQATGNRIRFTDPNSGLNYKNWQIFAGSGADERNLSFQSLSDAGVEYNFMTWRKATNSQLISNLYIPHLSTGSGTEVMTMDNVGQVWRSGLNTINGSSLFGSGNITTESPLSFSSPLSRSVNTISLPAASTSVSGHLTSTDWNTFNNKIGGSGTTNQIPYFSGSNTLTSSINILRSSSNGLIAGTNETTSGSKIISGLYGSGSIISTYYGSEFSTGAGLIGYFMDQNGSSTWRSTANFLVPRSALLISGDLSFISSDFQTVTTGNALTSQPTQKLRIRGSDGKVTISNLSGSGTRMVTTQPDGELGSAAIPVNTDAQNLSVSTKSGANIPINISGGTGINFTDGVGTSGFRNSGTSFSVDLSGQAAALHNLNTNGIIARTASGAVAARTLTQGQGIAITNGNGVAANPTIALSQVYGQLYSSETNSKPFNSTTATKIDFNLSFVDGITASALNDFLTIPATGVYEISYCVGVLNISAGLSTEMQIFRNGSVSGMEGSFSYGGSSISTSPSSYTQCKNFIVGLNINDEIDLRNTLVGSASANINISRPTLYIKRIK